jgi:hypothetical protein
MFVHECTFHLLLRQKVEPKGDHGQALGLRRTTYRTIGSGRAAQAVDTYRTLYLRGLRHLTDSWPQHALFKSLINKPLIRS